LTTTKVKLNKLNKVYNIMIALRVWFISCELVIFNYFIYFWFAQSVHYYVNLSLYPKCIIIQLSNRFILKILLIYLIVTLLMINVLNTKLKFYIIQLSCTKYTLLLAIDIKEAWNFSILNMTNLSIRNHAIQICSSERSPRKMYTCTCTLPINTNL